MDGFQPRKTGTEKELLYSRVVVPRQSVELILDVFMLIIMEEIPKALSMLLIFY